MSVKKNNDINHNGKLTLVKGLPLTFPVVVQVKHLACKQEEEHGLTNYQQLVTLISTAAVMLAYIINGHYP